MKIKDVKTYVVGNPPPHHGGGYWVFLKLTTDDNIEGFGEAYGVPFHPKLVARLVEDVVERYVIGANPFPDRKTLAHHLFERLHAAPGSEPHGCAERYRNGLLGHRGQGAQPAGLQPARRPGAREIAVLHVSLSRPCRCGAGRDFGRA